MSDGIDVDTGLVMTEDEQKNKKKNELGENRIFSMSNDSHDD